MLIRSKIFHKSMLAVGAIILAYTFALLLGVLPSVEKTTRYLEEQNGREVLSKVSLVARNMQINLENFQRTALSYHKRDLRNLTDSFWSLIQAKYEQASPENIGSILEQRGRKLHEALLSVQGTGRERMSSRRLRQAVLDYVRMYSSDQGSDNLFIYEGTTLVLDPRFPGLSGRDLAGIEDPDGVHFVSEFQKVCRKFGSGTVYYRWKHGGTGKMEDRVAYVFYFEPLDWVIGFSASIRDLQEAVRNEVIYLVKKVRYEQNNYFFIVDYNCRVVAHPYFKRGEDFSNVRDPRGNLIVPPMVEVARQKGEGFTRYWWKKDPDSPETSEKLSFSKDFPDWQMVIGTGTYIDDIQREVEKQKAALLLQLRTIMENTRIGRSGYLFLVDSSGRVIIHPDPKLVGSNSHNLKNPVTGNSIFDDLSKGANTRLPIYYRWDKPGDPGNYIYDKVSWVEFIPGLDWYVASSAYLDELQETSNSLRKGILFLGFFILLLSLPASFFFFRRLLAPISTLSALASRVTRGDYSARCEFESSDEIGVLAREFNTMVDTIEDNIRNLDQKVKEKTEEIEKQNMFFETLFDESSDGILLIKDNLFFDCNRSAQRMLDYDDKDELITLHPSQISPPRQPDGRDSLEKADEMMQIALDTGTHRFEWVHLRRDGSETFFEVVLTRVMFQGEILIHAVWRDINEKKRAEQQLKKTLSEFSAVMDAIDYGVLFMDDRLRARLVNRAFREMWGCRRSSWPGIPPCGNSWSITAATACTCCRMRSLTGLSIALKAPCARGRSRPRH